MKLLKWSMAALLASASWGAHAITPVSAALLSPATGNGAAVLSNSPVVTGTPTSPFTVNGIQSVNDTGRATNDNTPAVNINVSEALNYTASYVTHYGFILSATELAGGTGDRIGGSFIQTCNATLSGKSCVGGSGVAVAAGSALGNYTGENPRALVPAGLTGPVGAAVGMESDVETHSPVLIKNGLRVADENLSGGTTTHGSVEDAAVAIVNDSGNTAQGFNVGIQFGEGAQGYPGTWPILPSGTLIQAVNPNVALNYGIDLSGMSAGFAGNALVLPAATSGNGIAWGGNGYQGGSIASTATTSGGHFIFTDTGINLNNASGGTVMNVGGSTGADVVNQGYETQYSLTGYVYCNGSTGRCTAATAPAFTAGMTATTGAFSSTLSATTSMTVNGASNTGVFVNDTSGSNTSRFGFENKGTVAWALVNGSGNAAFSLNRYVSGTLADSPIQVSNSSGLVTMPDGVSTSTATLTGNATINAASSALYIANDTSGSGFSKYLMYNNGTSVWAVGNASSANLFRVDRYLSGTYTDSPITIANATGTVAMVDGLSAASGTFTGVVAAQAAAAHMNINETSGTSSGYMAYQSNGTILWRTTSNSSSGQFSIDRYVSGTLTDSPMTIVNATGVVAFGDGITVKGTPVLGNLSGTSASIGGSALAAGACSSATVTVTGATTAMAVEASPVTYPGDGIFWHGYVSAAGTVTVKVCAAAALTPTASAYNVRVLQ